MTTTGSGAGPDGARRAAFEAVWHDPPGVWGAFRVLQNIPISRRYMVAAGAFFLAGGALALVLRLQLAWPGAIALSPAVYNQLFTMHGTTMMFLVVIPFLEALAAYLLPLMLGTRELPFPRMTAFSFWTYVFGGLMVYASFAVRAAPDVGWFAYPPLAGPVFSPGLGVDFWDIGLSVAEIAAMGAAAELIVGVLRIRAPGMSLARLPMMAWAMLVTGVMIIFAFTPLVVATAMLELDRKGLTRFFDPRAGGDPLLWQHLFWMFGHPEVYIMFVPAVGVISHVVQTAAGRPLVAHHLMVLALVATGLLSFGLWAHHMFAAGLQPWVLAAVAGASMLIALPSGVQVCTWLATLGLGRLRWTTALRFVAGFVATFVLGGLTGVMLAVVPFNWQVHDTHFVVAHLHYVLIGGVLFPVFAGLYYWLPKITGRLLDERVGRWQFWLTFLGFHLTFFPMHVTGLLGMPRRVATYPEGLGWAGLNRLSTVGAFVFGAGVLLFIGNVLRSLRRGRPAGADPWGGDTLEWVESSPPPEAQFPELPVVSSRHPLWEPAPEGAGAHPWSALLRPLRLGPTTWRGALVVSAWEGRPLAIVHIPGPTLVPFVTAVGLTVLLVAALVDDATLGLIGGAVTAGGIVAWLWPRASERRALDELGLTVPGRLPLAMAGPLSNGWWGTVVLVLVLGTALATLMASLLYLEASRVAWDRPALALSTPALATGALVLGAGAPIWAVRTIAGGRPGGRRLALGAASTGLVAFLALLAASLDGSGLDPARSGAASAVMGLLGFQALVVLVLLVLIVVAQAWAWAAPGDPRGHAVAWNGALLGSFAGVSWLVVATLVYGLSRLA